jgi:hypothetical protein
MHLLTSNRGARASRGRGWPSGRETLGVAGATALSLALTACSSSSAPGATSPTSQPGISQPAATTSLAAASSSAQTLVTYHYGNDRQGLDSKDPPFRHIVVAWTTSGFRISGDIYAEPLIYGGMVLVVTEKDDLYALNAATGAVRWRLNVGLPAQSGSVQAGPGLGGCGDIFPLGMTGTPVIDAKTGVLYLVAEVQKAGTSTWTGVRHVMVAVRLSSHKVVWTRDVDPAHAKRGQRVLARSRRPGRVARGLSVPFRKAHGLVGALVRRSSEGGATLSELVRADPAFGGEALEVLDARAALKRRSTPGGTGPEAVRIQISRFRERLATDAARLAKREE